VRDLRYFFPIEIQFAVLVADWMKVAPPNHLQHRPASAVERGSHVLYRQAGARERLGGSGPESGIEQEGESVLEDGGLFARVGARQFRAKLNRRFPVDY